MKTTPISFEYRLAESQEDRVEYFRLHELVSPDEPMTMEEWEQRDADFPKDKKKERHVALRDGKVVGGFVVFESDWNATPDAYFASIVDENLNEDEIDEILGQAETVVTNWGGKELHNWVSGRRTSLTSALKNRSYEMTQSNALSELDLTKVDFSSFQEDVDRFDASGLKMVNFVDFSLMDPENWLRRFWNAEYEFFKDVPLPWEHKQGRFEDYEREFNSERKNWPFVYAVLDGEEIVATTMLFRSDAAPQRFRTGLTAVSRNYRRRGIATAIKVKALLAAIEAGATVVATDNEDNNPMLDLNKQLGFRVAYQWEGYKKVF